MGREDNYSLDYWRERAVILNDRLLDIGDDYYIELSKKFEQAAIRTQKEIESFYGRFAENNKITMAQAEMILTTSERERFALELDTYIEQASQFPYLSDWAKQLENASTVHQVTRLQSLELQMRHQAELFYGDYHHGFTEIMQNIYTEGYHQNIYEFQKEYGVGAPFATVDTETVKNIMVKPWTTDNKTFSSRIWEDRQELIDYLYNEMSISFIRGEGPDRMIKEVMKRFGVSSRDAARLIQTEGAFFSALSQRDSYKALGFKKYIIVTVNDEKRSDICREQDGEVYDLDDFKPGITANPFHPRCRSTTAPYAGNKESKKGPGMLYDHKKKEMYSIPQGMTYKEWYKEHVENKGVADNAKHGKIELTDHELGAINRYLGSESYLLNERLRDGDTLSEFEKGWLDDFNHALDKMDDYKGEAIRTMHLEEMKLNNFLNEYQPKTIIKSKAYLSFSKLSDYDDNANIRIGIISSSAKDISHINQAEQEVLYKIGSELIVRNVSTIDGVYYIILEEYNEGKK